MDEIELKPSDVCKNQSITTASLFTFSAITSHFPQLLKCDTDMVASYRIVPYLQRCYALLVTSNVVHDYLKVLYKGCNIGCAWSFTDISTLSLGCCAPSGSCV